MNRYAIGIAWLVATGCAASNGLDGQNALVNVVSEPAGSACEFGGVKIESGHDANADGALQPTEVDDTEYVCNGGESDATLTRASTEEPGDNCEFGGIRVDLGPDVDENGSLGDEEVEDTEYVCNGGDGTDGTDGMDGTNGTDGTNGVDGTDGMDGADGVSYLTSVVPISANGVCGSVSGVRVEAGPDTNANGTLDAAEVTDSEVVCDGVDGQDGSGGGSDAVIASNYSETSVVSSAGSDMTIISVSITVPSAGTVVVFGSTDAYCSSTGTPACDSGGITPAYTRVVNSPSGDPSSGTGWGYVHLQDDVTENVTRSNTFTVSSSGTYTYYLRGEAQFGNVGFWRNSINAVFVGN